MCKKTKLVRMQWGSRGLQVTLVLILGAGLLGCPWFRPKPRKCEAKLSYKGKRFKGVGETLMDRSNVASAKKRAVEAACQPYCYQADPAVKMAHEAYKKTVYGAASPRTQEEDLKKVPSLTKLHEACVKRCVEKGPADGSKISVTCEKK